MITGWLTGLLWSSLAATAAPHLVTGTEAENEQTSGEDLYAGSFDGHAHLHWVAELPGGPLNSAAHTERARPVIHGNYIYTGSAAGMGLYQLDRRSGRLVRTFEASSSVESEPLIIGEFVFFSDTGGTTWCYTLEGDLQWSHKGDAPVLVQPILIDGRIFVTNVDDLVVALQADSGELLWRYQRPNDLRRKGELRLYGAPPAVPVGDDILTGFSDGAVVALDQARGDVEWERRVGLGRYPDLIAAPNVSADLVFVSAYFEPTVALNQSDRSIRWEMTTGAASASLYESTEYGDALYHPGADGVLRKLSPDNGEQIWAWDSRTKAALTMPVMTPRGILVASSIGSMFLVDAASGALLWTWDPGVRLEGISTAPTVQGRQLVFLSNSGRIYSVLGSRPEVQWPGKGHRASRGDVQSTP